MSQSPLNPAYQPMMYGNASTFESLVPPPEYTLDQNSMMYGLNGSVIYNITIYQGPNPSPAGSRYVSLKLGQDGFLYAYPFNLSNNLLKINPSDGSFTTLTAPTGAQTYRQTTVAPNGDIIGIPSSAAQVCAYRPSTNTFANFGTTFPLATNKWGTGVIAQNGLIYCAPYDRTDILVIDPVARTTRTFGSIPGTFKYLNGILAPNGLIYYFPTTASETRILILNPLDESIRFTQSTLNSFPFTTTSPTIFAASLGFDNQIYIAPSNFSYWGIFDTVTESIRLIGTRGCHFGGNYPEFSINGGGFFPTASNMMLTTHGKFILPQTTLAATTSNRLNMFPSELDVERQIINRLSYVSNVPPTWTQDGPNAATGGCMDRDGNIWLIGNGQQFIMKISGFDPPTPDMITIPSNLSDLPTSAWNKFHNKQ